MCAAQLSWALRWDDIDLGSRQLHAHRALQRVDGKLRMVEPKTTTSRRSVVLPTWRSGRCASIGSPRITALAEGEHLFANAVPDQEQRAQLWGQAPMSDRWAPPVPLSNGAPILFGLVVGYAHQVTSPPVRYRSGE